MQSAVLFKLSWRWSRKGSITQKLLEPSFKSRWKVFITCIALDNVEEMSSEAMLRARIDAFRKVDDASFALVDTVDLCKSVLLLLVRWRSQQRNRNNSARYLAIAQLDHVPIRCSSDQNRSLQMISFQLFKAVWKTDFRTYREKRVAY